MVPTPVETRPTDSGDHNSRRERRTRLTLTEVLALEAT